MDIVWKIGELFLILAGVSLMLFYTAESQANRQETQEYVNAQNHSDAYAAKYASLSSFDADTVGKISVQEVLSVIFTHASDSSPVIVRGPDNVVHVYVTDNGGWTYDSYGKPVGRKLDGNGNYYDGTYNTNVGVLSVKTEPLPDYKTLYNYLSNNQRSDVYYLGNINPENKGDLRTILFVRTN